ncbi:MAG: BatA domain-containing protein [bacterium]
MFSFLNTTVLFAAAAALIPLIIHLFSRRRVKVVEFSSLRHLKAMQRRQVRRLKIRQLLLLILRMLIILGVVLAFARPTTKSDAVGSHAAVAAVILVDNSASMGRQVTDGNLYELSRQTINKILESFGEGDEVALLPVSRTHFDDRAVAFTSAALAMEELARLRPTPLPADFQMAYDQAGELLKQAASINKELYIVSDRQRRMLPQEAPTVDHQARVVFAELPLETSDNCGVVAIELGNRLVLPGREFEVVGRIRNYAVEARDDLIVSLFLDDRRVAQTDLTVPGDDEAAVRFACSVPRTGHHSGYVEISDDQLLVDNRQYFSFSIPEQFNVLIISDDDTGPLLALALTPSATLNRYWSIKQVATGELSSVNLNEYDLVILAGAPSVPKNHLMRLEAAVERGGSLLITYGAGVDTGYFNQRLTSLTGVVIDKPMDTGFSRSGYYSLSQLSLEHPIFSVFDYTRSELPTIKFFTLPKLHLLEGTEVLARFSGDRPALVENRRGQGRVITFTGPLSPDHSDIASHAFFVPFVSRCVEYLTSELSSFDLNQSVGQAIRRPVVMKGAVSYPLEVTLPDSTVVSVPPQEDQSRLTYAPQPVEQLGIYRTRYLGREVDRFALNLPPGEGDLSAADGEQWAAALGLTDYHVLASDADVTEAISELRVGRELWQLFLWIAFGLLVVEMLLSRSNPRED